MATRRKRLPIELLRRGKEADCDDGKRMRDTDNPKFATWFISLEELEAIQSLKDDNFSSSKLSVLVRSLVVILKVILLSTLSLSFAVITYFMILHHYTPQEEIISLNIPLLWNPCHESRLKCSDLEGNVTLRYRPPGYGIYDRKIPVFVPNQRYEVRIMLELPENDINREIGPFTACLDFRSEDGNSTLRGQDDLSDLHARGLQDLGVCRAVLMKHRSTLGMLALTVFKLPWLALDLWSETQEVEVTFFEDFQESQLLRSERATLRILNRDVQVTRAELRASTLYTGLRFMTHYKPVITGFLAVGFYYYTFLIFTLIFWLAYKVKNKK